MNSSRQKICDSTSAKLKAAAPTLAAVGATVGLDGFVDEIIAVVDKRHDLQRFDPVRTIGHFGQKVLKAAGESSNYELVVKQRKLGGNGPIMANALAAIGLGVTYVGCLGYPNLDPVFDELAARSKVISISEPGHTDALEFDDGKLMLGKHQSLGDVNWDNLISRVSIDGLVKLFSDSKLIGMVNWTMLPHMSKIWAHLADDVLPRVPRQGRRIFVDLCDPEKRTPADIRDALKLLTRFQGNVDVILGLNLKEAGEILEVLNLPVKPDPEAAIEQDAAAIRAALGLYCVVVHPRRGAAAATEKESARFAGPFVQQPRISTGAGDHFNAGFSVGSVLGMSLEESLCLGVSTSGFYVRSAQSPTAAELAAFIAELPPPQE